MRAAAPWHLTQPIAAVDGCGVPGRARCSYTTYSASPPPPSRPSLSQITTQQQQGHWVICERRVPCPCPEQRSGEINHWVPAAATTGPARSRVSASHAWAPTCRDFVVGFVSPGGRVSAGGGCIGLRHPLLVPHRRRTLLDHVTSLQVLRPTSIGKTCRPIMQALCRGGEAAGCCGPITPALWPANRQQQQEDVTVVVLCAQRHGLVMKPPV